MRTQNHTALLAGSQNQFRQQEDRRRTLAAAMLLVANSLRCRPAPRWRWDEVARSTEPAEPWEAIQIPMTAAVDAGANDDDVLAFYLKLYVDAYRNTGRVPSLDPTSACMRAIKEQSEAIEAQAIARIRSTPENIARLITETKEAIGANRVVIALHERAQRMM